MWKQRSRKVIGDTGQNGCEVRKQKNENKYSKIENNKSRTPESEIIAGRNFSNRIPPGKIWNSLCILAFGALLAVGMAATLMHLEKQKTCQQELARQVIRFHILADSDSEADQATKLAVKERLIPVIAAWTGQADTQEEAGLQIRQAIPEIERQAQMEIQAAGGADTVEVLFTKEYFPVKRYGAYVFPAGRYQTLTIRIGEARGHNWWCMLYPSLCFADALHPKLREGAGKLKRSLSDDAYLSILEEGKIDNWFRWF